VASTIVGGSIGAEDDSGKGDEGAGAVDGGVASAIVGGSTAADGGIGESGAAIKRVGSGCEGRGCSATISTRIASGGVVRGGEVGEASMADNAAQ
jgi:hypothetical protein